MNHSSPPFEVLPRDLSAYRKGNVGIDHVHQFKAAQPGPHVLINALIHGNEFCGMVALTHLLDTGFRPLRGTLTLCFSNTAAYETFDPNHPFDSRQVVHNMNRVWSSEWLDGPEDSPELRRARVLRPLVAAADHILDLHSTAQDVDPFWVYPAFARNQAVANAIAPPTIHLTMPHGLGSGTPLIQFGTHAEPQGTGAALVAECGQHFKLSSAQVATQIALDFLSHFGLREPGPRPVTSPPRRFELLQTWVIQTPEFAFTRPVIGFETFANGELIATDGVHQVRAPCDDCTILMPTRAPAIVGREGVYLAKPLP